MRAAGTPPGRPAAVDRLVRGRRNGPFRAASAAAPDRTEVALARKRKTADLARSSPSPTAAHTPLLRVALALSLDGYIATEDGGVGWLDEYFVPEVDFPGFLKTIGATVMGRRTYDEALARGYPAGGGGRSLVLTHRPLAATKNGPEAWSGNLAELARRLRGELAATGKDVWLMGGGESIAAFHAAGLVDRWELSIIPVLLGSGIPLFPRGSRGVEGLRRTHHRMLSNGIAELWYEPR